MLKKLMVVALIAVLVNPSIGASATAPADKKLTVAQGKRIYDQAVKATSIWMANTPFSKTSTIEDSTITGRPFTITNEIIDRNNNISFEENGEKSFIIGETMYDEIKEYGLADFELAIAEDLGLNLNAKYLSMEPLLVNPDYPLIEFRAVFRLWASPDFTGDRTGAKSTAVTYRKTGSTELLTVTLNYTAKNGLPAAKRVYTTKIERGLIITTTALEISSGDRYRTTTTFKAFSGTITAPAGPYLDYTRIFLDPRYGKVPDGKSAGIALKSYVREAKIIAAFESVEKLSIEIWKMIAKDVDKMVIYDKGVEFSYGPENDKRACGVFTDEGADLKLVTCSELGFTIL